MFVYYHASCYVPCFYIENEASKGSLQCFPDFQRVAFPENALFKSSGVICWPPRPSSLTDELSMDKRASNGFLLMRRVHILSDRFYYPTDLSLLMAHWQISFLAFCVCLNCSWYYCLWRNSVQDACIFVVTPSNVVQHCGTQLLIAMLLPSLL